MVATRKQIGPAPDGPIAREPLGQRNSGGSRLAQLKDAQCIAEILGGDEDAKEPAYRDLMQRYWKLVTALVTAQISDSREAEDVTQEAFLRAFRSLHKLKEPKAFLGWLLRIARNQATDRMRVRKHTVSLDSLRDTHAETHEPALRMRDPLAHETHLQRREELGLVLEALSTLPAKYREVVALRYLQGLDGRAMATALGEPEGTVRNRLFRAVEKLRARLLEDDNFAGLFNEKEA